MTDWGVLTREAEVNAGRRIDYEWVGWGLINDNAIPKWCWEERWRNLVSEEEDKESSLCFKENSQQ